MKSIIAQKRTNYAGFLPFFGKKQYLCPRNFYNSFLEK
jgi:hypothetical protein